MPGHIRRDVHHVAVPLDHHHVRQFHRPVLGDTSHVVAAQIDQHHMFRPFLRIGQQFFGQPPILVLVRPAHPGPGQRPHGDLSVHHATHDLRRAADQGHARRAEEEHERTGVHDPQRAIDFERIAMDFQLQALADHDLEDVTSSNVLDALADRLLRSPPG